MLTIRQDVHYASSTPHDTSLNLLLFLQYNQTYFYCSHKANSMFLQRYKHSRHGEMTPPQKQPKYASKIQALLKQVGIPEIKQHQKRNSYLNPRTYLIENTRRVIKKPLIQNQQNVKISAEGVHDQSIFSHMKAFSRTNVDLSSREGRRAAAKSFRERIWKSSDITPLVKAQEQRLLLSAKGPSPMNFTESQQKIHRYQDSFLLTDDPSRREAARKQYLEGVMRNNLSLRTNSSHKNPEKLQITNIEFNKEEMEESNNSSHSRQVINRERRKEMRVLHYSSLGRPERRPNTTGGYNREPLVKQGTLTHHNHRNALMYYYQSLLLLHQRC